MKKTSFLILFILSISCYSQDQFRQDYNLVSIYDSVTEKWSDWKEGYNTFVINYNNNGDVAHFKANGEKVVYRRISRDIEDGYTDSNNEHYQIIKALDENGLMFLFQFFDNPKIGLKIIYDDIMIQFSEE